MGDNRTGDGEGDDEQIEHQKSEVTKAITDLETLLASRMQHWFE